MFSIIEYIIEYNDFFVSLDVELLTASAYKSCKRWLPGKMVKAKYNKQKRREKAG